VSRLPKRPRKLISNALKREEVRKLLWDARVLREPDRLSDAAEIKLTQGLNSVQQSFRIDEVLSLANEVKGKMRAALQGGTTGARQARRDRAAVLKAAEAAAEANPERVVYAVSAAALKDRVDEIAKIDDAMREVAAWPVLAAGYSAGEQQRWGDHAIFIFNALRKALSCVGKSVGVSDDGPAARFQEREMAEGSYSQFCPVAMAAEILCARWTIVLLRELVAGSTRFNELRRGVPRMSPALLSKRLKDLEAAGIVARRQLPHEPEVFEYTLTPRRKGAGAGRHGGWRVGTEVGQGGGVTRKSGCRSADVGHAAQHRSVADATPPEHDPSDFFRSSGSKTELVADRTARRRGRSLLRRSGIQCGSLSRHGSADDDRDLDGLHRNRSGKSQRKANRNRKPGA